MSEEKTGKAKTILCVDDDPNVLASLKRVLRPLAYDVLTAGGGEEALLLAAKRTPDLVLLDVMMPEMDGYETLAKLREAGLDETPVIMLTGMQSGENLIQGYAQGCVYYITKPCHNDQVVTAVQYLIGNLSDSERRELELKL